MKKLKKFALGALLVALLATTIQSHKPVKRSVDPPEIFPIGGIVLPVGK